MRQHFALCIFVITSLQHEIGNQPKDQASGDAPITHACQQHNNSQQHAADSQHPKLLDFREKQHHGDASDQRDDHTDEWDEDRDKPDGCRCKNDNKIDCRKNTDLD